MSSGCHYHVPVAYPEKLEGGLRTNRLTGSSVEYGIAIFRPGEELSVADGFCTHVFVDRTTGMPVRMPEFIRSALEKIRLPRIGSGFP